MKKTMILFLTVIVIFNLSMVFETNIIYADEPNVIWLEKDYDVVGFFYEDVNIGFKEGLAMVCLDNKYGYIDGTGKEVVPLKYDYVSYEFSEGLAMVNIGNDSVFRYLNIVGKFGFIDKTGKEVIPLKYDDVSWEFSEGLVGVKLNGKWGYVDKTGKEIIPFKYDSVSQFHEGLTAVRLDGKYGYIDKTGKEVTPFKYDLSGGFSEGLAYVKLNGKYGYIDKTGKEVIPFKYDYASYFKEGLAIVGLNGKYGYIDKTGKEVIPLKYDTTWNFHEGLAGVRLEDEGDIGYIDKTGKVVIPIKYWALYPTGVYNYFKEGLTMVCLYGKYGYVDKTGKEVIPFKYDSTANFSEGLAAVGIGEYSDTKYGYIDKTGKEVIPFKYDYAYDFTEGLAFVKLNGKWGIIQNPLSKQQEKKLRAIPAFSRMFVNGKEISFDAYLIEDNNYFKLRDLATVVNGTEKEFEVVWNEDKGVINLISNKAYTSVGGEMAKGDGEAKIPTLNMSTVYKDGVELELTAYTINGNNYFKLRDVAKVFDIGVTWNNVTKTVGIDTTSRYISN